MTRSPVNARTTLTFMCGFLLLVAVWPAAAETRAVESMAFSPLEAGRACPNTDTVATYPYFEDFEDGTGLWANVDGDDFDWDHNQGSTPSDDTGPDVDHTLGTDQGHYMYTEASGDNNPEKTALLHGPLFDLTALSVPQLSFWYHSVGDGIGHLYVEVSADDCATWDVGFEMHGPQWGDWHLGLVDLSPHAGQTVSIRFRGITGDYYSGDLALDDIYVGERVLYDGGCCDLVTGDCVGYMTEPACDAYGDTAWYLHADCMEENFCPQPPPENDLCEDAELIDTLPYETFDVAFKWATPDLPVSCDADECEDSAYGVWYTFTTTDYCGARLRLDTVNGGTNTFIAAFSGTDCGNLSEVFCSSEQESSAWQEVTFNLDAGTTYWLLIGSFWCEGQPWPDLNIIFDCSLGACCLGETCSLETVTDCEDAGGYYFGDNTTCVPDACLYGACCTDNGCESLTETECASVAGDFLGNGVPCELDTCPPINESCEEAIVVTDGAPAAEGDTTLASFDDDEEASCFEWSDKDLWYEYTATCTGTVAVDTEGSELWDTVLSAWDECDGEEIACETDGPSGSLAAMEFDAIAGESYFIRMAPNGGANGMFQLNISCNEAAQGACCLGLSCMVDYQLTCEAAGGSYWGDDSDCPGDDCNSNGFEDICDLLNGDSDDCNDNEQPDECDIAEGASFDRDDNGTPDECDSDCNDNGIIDGCDVTCIGGCADFTGCGQSDDCQADGMPDECQLEDEGCEGVRLDHGEGDLVDGVRPDWGWENYGVADDFTLDEDMEGTCFQFDIYDHADSENLPVMRVRIFENYDGLMALGQFSMATPVFDETYSLEDGTLEIHDTGEDLQHYDLLRFVASGTDWSLNEGDYAIHLTFPETGESGFWATAGTDDSDCAIFWGDWSDWPYETCWDGVNMTNLAFALLGPADNDCNGNDVPDECDIEDGFSRDCNDNGTPDECELCGDLDWDDDVDYYDYEIFLEAFGGVTDGVPAEDACCDYDDTGAVGMADYATWLACYRDYVGNPLAGAPAHPLDHGFTPAEFELGSDREPGPAPDSTTSIELGEAVESAEATPLSGDPTRR